MRSHSPDDKSNSSIPFWCYDVTAICSLTRSTPKGLTTAEADERHGAIHAARKTSGWQKDIQLLLRQFKSALVLMLVGAVLLSFFIGEQSDAIIILLILIASGFLSF